MESIELPAAGWQRIDDFQRGLPGTVRVVVVGSDVDPDAAGVVDDDLRARVLAWLRRPDVVSIAVLKGRPTAGSLALALACDLRVATDEVVVEVAAAVHPGVVTQLARRTGYSTAMSMLLAGRRLSAADALDAGLIDQLVGAASCDAELRALIGALLVTPRETAAELKSLLLRAVAYPGGSFEAEVQARDRMEPRTATTQTDPNPEGRDRTT